MTFLEVLVLDIKEEIRFWRDFFADSLSSSIFMPLIGDKALVLSGQSLVVI